MAGYKQKQRDKLQKDAFRDSTVSQLELLLKKVEGRGRQVLIGLVAVVAVLILAVIFVQYRGRKSQQAEYALAQAIRIHSARVTQTPVPGSTDPTFTTDKERAEKAVQALQDVANRYPDPYHSNALYLMALDLLVVDRARGLAELDKLARGGPASISPLAKFALAQASAADGKYDTAAVLYQELAGQLNGPIPAETAQVELAAALEKQGKKQQAADILFTIVDAARKSRDEDGKARAQTGAQREAADKLQKLDPERFAKLPPPASSPMG